MKINSGNKVFDHQTTSIFPGEHKGGTQLSVRIEGGNGRARKHAIEELRRAFGFPPPKILKYLDDNVERPVYVHQFFHTRGGQKLVHGWVITDAETNELRCKWASERDLSRKILKECITYITPISE